MKTVIFTVVPFVIGSFFISSYCSVDAFLAEKRCTNKIWRSTHSPPSLSLFSSRTDVEIENSCVERRQILGWTIGATLSGLIAGGIIEPAYAAAGTDEVLFKKNPLLNPILEQIRIWEQAEADNIKYGGELERGDAGNKGKVDAYPKLLVPILQIAYELERMNQLIQSRNGYAEAMTIINQPKYQKILFKRTFNAYADNIYYSDPDRANLYLAGGGKFHSYCNIASCCFNVPFHFLLHQL